METVYEKESTKNDPKEKVFSVVESKPADSKSVVETKEVKSAEVAEVKKDNKESAEKKPKKSVTKRLGCYLMIFFGLLLLFAGIALGVWAYPRAQQWLTDHNFAGGNQPVNNTGNPSTTGNTNVLLSEESTVINVVKASKDSVVSIAVSQPVMTSGKIVDKSSNIGSGFIVDSNGIIVTNQHVVSDLNSDYVIVTSDGKEHKVVSITRDDLSDIAVIKADATGLKAVNLGDSDSLQIGQLVVAIGTPLGDYAGSVTTGVISGLDRSVTATQGSFWGMAKDYENVIQTDAAINPGNSGGPLLNSNGEVIGVNFATSAGASNISFALPINTVKSRLEEYRKFGKFMIPFLGVSYEMISQAEATYYKVAPGALISKIGVGTPAEVAGLQARDIIISVNGVAVDSSLQATLQKFKVGDEVTLKIWRDGKEIDVKVTLGEGQ